MLLRFAFLLFAGACTPQTDEPTPNYGFSVTEYGEEKPENVEPTEGWSRQDRPTLFSRDLVTNVDELPWAGEAEQVPWAGSYWPVYKDSINDKWDGEDSMSPAAKYGAAFGIDDFEDAVSKHHGIDGQDDRTACESTEACNTDIGETCAKRDGQESGYCIPKWWGICHAWAPVAIMEPEPQKAVTVNGVEFKINDIKALITLAYNRTHSRFVGLRCDEDDSEEEIEYDEYDRPTGDDEECRDTNPGTYHVLLANYLGLKGQSFVEDRTFDNEVWNQPIRGYRITTMDPIDVARAHELIGVPEPEAPGDSNDDAAEAPNEALTYKFNDDAETLYYVKLEVDYMIESPSTVDGNLAERADVYTNTDRYEYVLEVDHRNEVIGGEWVGNSKREHPDFLWLPTERGFWPKPAGGKLNWDLVKDLIESSQIAEEPSVEIYDNGFQTNFTIAKGEWRTFGPYDVLGSIEATISSDGDGDADLYVRKSAAPTEDEYDCRPYDPHSNESCSLNVNNEPVHVSVFGYSDATVELRIGWEDPTSSGSLPDETGHINDTGSVVTGEMALYVMNVEPNDSIRIRTESDTDVDLYVRFANPPTTSDYDARGYTVSGDETIDFDANEAGELHIGVHGWITSDYSLNTAAR
ncbi:MAG: pre-peptidase C-terminal domain-containing protein [Myxococcota bacterium]|nr:pre-peptidase C-terminal domain-containing protein [Myxococcota bacterium]